MFKAHDLWGIISVMLLLIAIYLVLRNYVGTTQILGTTFQGGGNLFKTLQGR